MSIYVQTKNFTYSGRASRIKGDGHREGEATRLYIRRLFKTFKIILNTYFSLSE